MSDIHNWDPIADNNTQAPPDGAPENVLSSALNNVMREYQASIRRWQLDNDGSLGSSGTGTAYVLTPNGTYTSYHDGMMFVFTVHTVSTGPATLAVGALAPQTLQLANGDAIAAGTLTEGTRIWVSYDNVEGAFRVLNAGVAGSTEYTTPIKTTATNPVDLADSDAALVIGPPAGAHLEADSSNIQAKNGASSTATLRLNPYGGDIRLSHSLSNYLLATHSGLQARSTIDSLGRSLFLNSGGGSIFLGDLTTSVDYVELRNAYTRINGRHASAHRVRNATDGLPPITSAQNVYTTLERSDGTDLADTGFLSSDYYAIRSYVWGGGIRLQADDATGTLREVFIGEPDGAATLHHAGVSAFQTAQQGLTSSDAMTSAQIRDVDGFYRDAGIAPCPAVVRSSNFTLSRSEAYRTVILTGASMTVTLANFAPGTDIPVNAWGWLLNDSGGSVSIGASGVIVKCSTGTVPLLANLGTCRWWKRSNVEFWVMAHNGVT